ncbi:MAG: hypothetical protein LN414_01660, partial [Candidatus Thermoplasmatota archaeon]|nr:hypothetical protein [Candidatus Thermoplasmatota archaeon]
MAKPSREARTGMGSPPKWGRQLKRRMDPGVVSLDPTELSLYDRDAAPLPASAKWAFNPRPDAVVRPR